MLAAHQNFRGSWISMAFSSSLGSNPGGGCGVGVGWLMVKILVQPSETATSQ